MAESLVEPQKISISDTEPLMRWVNKYGVDKRADGTVKKLRPGAFPLAPTDAEGFSLFLERLMTFDVCRAKALINNSDNIGIVRMVAKDFRDYDLDVVQKTQDGEIAHCEVTKYEAKTADELTDIKRQWILRCKESFTRFD